MQLTDALDELIQSKGNVKGHLHNYRLCDEVWTFIVKNAQFKLDNGELLPADRVKIVACKMGEGSTR